MRKSELSTKQLRDLNIFNLLMDFYGWKDRQGVEEILETGKSSEPEGQWTLFSSHTKLRINFHAPVGLISLLIEDVSTKENIQYHFIYDERPEQMLEHLGSVQQQLSIDNHEAMLKGCHDACDIVLCSTEDMEVGEFTPPSIQV